MNATRSEATGDPLASLLSQELHLPPAEAGAFQDALRGILSRHPEVRGATVYGMARGETMVRMMTARGWTPVLVRAGERRDAHTIARRLESALEPLLGIC